MELCRTRAEVRSHPSSAVRDLGEGTLAPGTVSAHSHLELTGLAVPAPERAEAPGDFVAWVRRVLEARSTRALEPARAARAGARALLATGTTAVGDVDASGAAAAAAAGVGLRVRAYREVLDAGDPARTEAALAAVREPLAEGDSVAEGISPHAPHTVSDGLLDAVGALVRERGLPLAMHWAESLDEEEWLERGSGAFGDLLASRPDPDALERLRARGLLGPGTSLVHANRPRPGDVERVAASGAAVVHCPGTHRYFRRAPFALAAWRRAGVPLALGTDSEASNTGLDMGLEMRLLREDQPGLAPREVWELATLGGARALGFAGRAGELVPGAWADLCLHATENGGAEDDLELLTRGAAPLLETRVAGRLVHSAENPVQGGS